MLDLKRLPHLERPAPFFFASRYAKELRSTMQSQGIRDVIICPMSVFPERYPDLPEASGKHSVPLNARYTKATTDDPNLITVLISSFRPQDLERLLQDIEDDPRAKARMSEKPEANPIRIMNSVKPGRIRVDP